MAKYLVTGGCGFIGSHLVENLLSQGHGVVLLDNLSSSSFDDFSDRVKLIVGDVCDNHLVGHYMGDVDGCFHLAEVNPSSEALNISDSTAFHDFNVLGFLNVMEAAKLNRTPVVYSSSAAVYGDNADFPLREDATTQPVATFGADKLSCEHHARVFSMQHNVPTIGLRFFNVYGPSVNPEIEFNDVVSEFLYRIQTDEDVYVFGDGEQTRDFVYVGDAVNFLLAGMKNINMSPMVFNVCTGKGTTISQLIKVMSMVLGKRANVKNVIARQEDVFASLGDPQKAKKYLSLETQVSLFQGLRYMVDCNSLSNKNLDLVV